MYPEAALGAVNQLCREHGLYHISDEAYEYFTYGNARHFSPASMSGAEQYTISLYSLSKAYGFASWRVGYLVIPEALLPSLLKVQDTNLICPPLITQYAAIGAAWETLLMEIHGDNKNVGHQNNNVFSIDLNLTFSVP